MISEEKISCIILYIFILCVFFLRWAFNVNFMPYIVLISALIIFILKRKVNKNEFISILFMIIYILINLLITPYNKYYKSEIVYYIIIPSMIPFIFGCFSKNIFNKEDRLYKIMKFLNIYVYVNFVIMLMQIIFPGFLVHNFSNNTFYPDNITGLIGDSGTHLWSFIYIISIYLNIIYYLSNKKKISIINVLLIICLSIMMSFFNDNKFYIVMLLVFLTPIIFNIKVIFNNKITTNKNKSLVIYIIFIILSLLLMLFSYFYFAKVKGMYILNNERITMFRFSIINNNPNPIIGHGIGSIKFLGDENMPLHFGMCEITSRIYTGGILYLFLIINIFIQFFCNYSKKIEHKSMLFIIFSILLLCYYSQIFTNYYITFLMCFLYCVYLYFNKIINERGAINE